MSNSLRLCKSALVAVFFLTIFSVELRAEIPPEAASVLNPTSSTSVPASEAGGEHVGDLGKSLPLWSGIPFIGILLSIAIFPLVAPRFWHHNFGKISAGWALLFAIPFLFAYHGQAFHEILHIYLADYFPFIILLWALFTAAGGIVVEGRLPGTPIANTLMLIVGTAIASWIGTTGASMVLIRPMLRMNKNRQSKVHLVVFFIFLVSNIGGSLTPLGDPPLFLGFLHGVPFFWTLHLFPHMMFVVVIILVLFFAIDTWYYRKEQTHRQNFPAIESPADAMDGGNLRVSGLINFLFLGGILAGVLMSGIVKLGEFDILGVHVKRQDLLRDFLLIVMGLLSLKFTSQLIREKNGFTWFPIKEVAYLFAGIFMTIVPMLAMLKAGDEGSLAFLVGGVKEPWHYFWICGGLSSFLDNAPTYLTFFNSALGRFFPGQPELEAVTNLIAQREIYLTAISTGAVFMGANTYIGNAPNFMVKSIAEENGVNMPSFFGFMIYSVAILAPIFVLVTFVFFL